NACTCSIRARSCRNRTCRATRGSKTRRSTPTTSWRACGPCERSAIRTARRTSPRRRRPSRARPASTRWSRTCRASAPRAVRSPASWCSRRTREPRHEPGVGPCHRRDHGDPDAELHRHLDLGMEQAAQEEVRRAFAHPDEGRRGQAMSLGWSLWVMFLVVFNMGITFFLFIWGQRVEIPVLPDGTSGHVWAHGVLREGVRKLPRWWVFLSASMFAWGIAYLVLYPGFGSSKGVLGWTSHGELAD